MPEKTVKIDARDEDGKVILKDGKVVKIDTGRKYEIDGKKFIWHPLDDNDEPGNLPDVVIPMRIKLKVIRGLSNDMDPEGMFAMLEKLIPGQADTLDEMDVITDFQMMFETWQAEYNALAGATPGE